MSGLSADRPVAGFSVHFPHTFGWLNSRAQFPKGHDACLCLRRAIDIALLSSRKPMPHATVCYPCIWVEGRQKQTNQRLNPLNPLPRAMELHFASQSVKGQSAATRDAKPAKEHPQKNLFRSADRRSIPGSYEAVADDLTIPQIAGTPGAHSFLNSRLFSDRVTSRLK